MIVVSSISVLHDCQVKLISAQPGKHEAWTSMGEDVSQWSNSPDLLTEQGNEELEEEGKEEEEEDSEEDSEEEWHRFF